jgi:ribosomal protein S17E
MSVNVEKLAKRYPEKFTEYHAENRDLESERKILERTSYEDNDE